MARGTTASERAAAVEVITPDADIPDDDVEAAFDDWRASIGTGESKGLIRAYEIPMDERGMPNPSAKNQTRLGAWPIDMFAFDDLCSMLVRDFMRPGGTLAVRFLGTRSGSAGIQFNKVVVLRAPAEKRDANGAAAGGESMSTLLRAINENNERMLQTFRSMLPQAPPPDPRGSIRDMLEVAALMNGPQNKMLELLLPALAGRPAPAAAAGEPFSQLSGLLDLVGKLQDMRGGGEGGGGGDGIVDILKAVAPMAKPLLEALPVILARAPPRQPAAGAGAPRALPSGATPAPRPAAAPAPGSEPTQPQNPTPTPAAGVAGDIPSGDAQVFAQLKPQVDALVTMAAQGSDADGAADLLYDQVTPSLSDDDYDKLYGILSSPNFVTNAAVLNPGVSAHADWFNRFKARVIARYDAEEAAARDAPSDG